MRVSTTRSRGWRQSSTGPWAGRRGFAASPSACALAESSKDLLQRWKDEVGFPHGEIEDILNLSDPPWHTACPNPFLSAFVEVYGNSGDPDEPYRRKPFAVDVSEGKRPIPSTGRTAITPKSRIWQSCPPSSTTPSLAIWSWTGFAGTGMTGVAAQWCGTAPESYRKSAGRAVGQGGLRQAELGPSPHDPERSLAARRLHRRQLRPAFRYRRVCRGRPRVARRGRGGTRLDV